MSETLLFNSNCLDILPTLPDNSIDMMFADLPYGVTANKWDTVIPFEPLWRELIRVGKKNCAFVFTATQPFATALINSQPKLFRYDLVWLKNQHSSAFTAKVQPLRQHESIFVFYAAHPTYNPQKTDGPAYTRTDTGNAKSGNFADGKSHLIAQTRVNDGSRHPVSFLSVPLDARSNMKHPTQKPVALLEWLIKTYSNPGDVVLDPTMGSGTTGVACVNTGRDFVGIEMDPTYFATCQKRIDEAQDALANVHCLTSSIQNGAPK